MTTLRYPGVEHQPGGEEKPGRLAQGIRRVLRAQFGRPTGLLGGVAGFIMARTPSNLDRIRWTLSLLDVKPRDRVLEVGFGPGVAIALLSRLAGQGLVVGIDHSDAMVRRAARRNAKAIREGRVALHCAPASDPPAFAGLFDKILTINSIHFWNDPVACLGVLRGRLRPGGLMAVTLQPRMRTATDESAAILGEEIAANLRRAGFSHCDVKIRKSRPVAMACVLATN